MMPRSTPKDLIRLAVRAGKASQKSYGQFEREFEKRLGISTDYARRVLSGTRKLTEEHLEILKDVLGIEIDFDISEREFASTLGLSRKEAAQSIGDMSPGLDLTARTSDRRQVANIQREIGGYWESIYWSVSNTKEQAVSRDLCIIGEIDEENYIECKIIDGHFEYSGVIFPVIQHLYFVLEKERFFNEVIFYVTNLPDRTPPVLRGIICCLSGGVNDSRCYPSASKVAFRYLGRTGKEVRRIYPNAPDDASELNDFLRAEVPTYITRKTIDGGLLNEEALAEIRAIDNSLHPDAIPFALRSMD